jgi:hypothetical protein
MDARLDDVDRAALAVPRRLLEHRSMAAAVSHEPTATGVVARIPEFSRR